MTKLSEFMGGVLLGMSCMGLIIFVWLIKIEELNLLVPDIRLQTALLLMAVGLSGYFFYPNIVELNELVKENMKLKSRLVKYTDEFDEELGL